MDCKWITDLNVRKQTQKKLIENDFMSQVGKYFSFKIKKKSQRENNITMTLTKSKLFIQQSSIKQ